jgi:hypothetical protein
MTPTISDIIDQIHTARDWLSADGKEVHGKAIDVRGNLFGTLLIWLDTGFIVVWRLKWWQVYFVLRGLKKSGMPV